MAIFADWALTLHLILIPWRFAWLISRLLVNFIPDHATKHHFIVSNFRKTFHLLLDYGELPALPILQIPFKHIWKEKRLLVIKKWEHLCDILKECHIKNHRNCSGYSLTVHHTQWAVMITKPTIEILWIAIVCLPCVIRSTKAHLCPKNSFWCGGFWWMLL